jgi:4-amino-4-deoxy-L-arabinose transferase-like glycosyltransferase
MKGVTPIGRATPARGRDARSRGVAIARRWVGPAALVVVALALRIGAVATDTGYEPRHDAFDYHRHGVSIATGDGFPESILVADGGPSALRGPGYPYFLGVVYSLTDATPTAGRIANALLGALVVLLLYLVVAAVWPRRIALVAGALAAVFPPLVLVSRELFSESLFIVLVLAAVLAVLRFRRSGGAMRWAAAAGAVCGLAALTRNPGIVLVVPIAIGAWWGRPLLTARSIAAPVTVMLCAAVVVLPWTVRNGVEFGRFIPVTTSSGFALAGTYNESSRADDRHPAGWRTPETLPQYEVLFRTPGVDEGTLDSTLRGEATEFAWGHPTYVAEVGAWNLLRLLYLADGSVVDGGKAVTETGIGSRSALVERVSLWIAALLALLGSAVVLAPLLRGGARAAYRRVRRAAVPRGPLFLWLVPATILVVTVPVAGLPRYRAPIDPFVLILAAIGIVWILDRVTAARRQAAAGPGAAVALVGALAAIAIGGCGDGDDGPDEVPQGATSAPAERSSSDAPTKARYITRADAICREALRETRRVGRRFDAGGGISGATGDPQLYFTETVVIPGLEIRERQAERIRRLEPPAETSEDLDVFLGLFDTLEELSRQRIRASRKGDVEEMSRIDELLNDRAAEQIQVARRFGFEDCAADFLLAAFPSTPPG